MYGLLRRGTTKGPRKTRRKCVAGVSTPNNRISASSGFTFDAAGNIINDSSHTYIYDAENRIVQVDSGSTAVYAYDAEGRRVAKTASSAGGAFEYLYDLHGRAVTEMGAGTSSINRTEVYAGSRHVATQNVGLSTTYFMHSDWLGTKRVASGLSGTAMQTCTSLVYGDSMTCAGPFASPQNFTGQMRDAETQLVEFPARYYSPTQGRWYSPDWASAQVAVPYADLHNPQSLNLYDYVGSDPTNHADADGHLQNCPGCDRDRNLQELAKDKKAQADAQTSQNKGNVTVTVEKVKSANPFGHVVIKVGAGPSVGLVPNSDKDAAKAVAKEAASAGKGVTISSPVPGHVEELAPNRVVQSTATIQVTSGQAEAMQMTINQAEAHAQQYDPAFNNCASFVENVLRSGGVNAPNDITPGGLVTDLKQQNPQ